MSRPKGYADWNPAPETLAILEQVKRILNEYRSYGPMTARQIFYRLVGQYGYDKTEKAYKRLTGYLVRARRAKLIPFHAIRDDGTTVMGGGGWASTSQFWSSVRYTAEGYELDHQQDQPYDIELWCEAAGMAPMLSRMTQEWHIPVYSTGGFSSVTVTHEMATRVARRSRTQPTVMLHVGDFDPSGESIFESMSQDIMGFLREMVGYHDAPEVFIPCRIALTEEQVEEYNLPTAPPKASDSRSANWLHQTTQLEAMPPDLLERVVKSVVEEYVDQGALQDTLAQEEEDRQSIMRVLELTGE